MPKAKSRDDNKLSFGKTLRNNFFLLRIAWRIKPSRIVCDFLFHAVDSIFGYYYSIVFLGVLYSAVEKDLGFGAVLIFIAVTMALFLILRALGAWYWNSFRAKTDIDFYESFNRELFAKAADVDLACYENTEFYTRYTRAASETGGRIASILDNMTSCFGSLFSTILILITIFALDPLAVVFLIFPIVLSLMVRTRRNKARYRLEMANTDPVRQKDYVHRTIYLESYAKEQRLTNIFHVLTGYYARSINQLCHNYRTLGRRVGAYRALDMVLSIAQWPLVIIYAGYRVLISQTISAGIFVVLVNAINQMVHSLEYLMHLFTTMQQDGMFVQNFRDFMDYEPKIAQGQEGMRPSSRPHTLELRHVSFAYEGAKKRVLEDVSFTLRAGETIALVGHNGAGKTTLIKLLLRLYDPTEGVILLDGVDIREYSVQEYRKLFGTVFQDYRVFAMSAAENVLMHPVEQDDYDRAAEALRSAGVYDKILESPKGLDAMLTREFDDDGLVLSGGEFQKLAIARLYAGSCEFAVLDEPSSALDPIAEYEMFENLKRVCAGKTVVFISHRLSSAVLADQVYLMEHGRVLEQGTHASLMQAQGRYAKMFQMQARMYGLAGGEPA